MYMIVQKRLKEYKIGHYFFLLFKLIFWKIFNGIWVIFRDIFTSKLCNIAFELVTGSRRHSMGELRLSWALHDFLTLR